MNTYDVAIVGGGPAGLSAALHLGWHNRDVVVIDRRTGPLFFTTEKLHNVPGFGGMSGVDIQRSLKKQVESMGVKTVRGNVIRADGEDGRFTLTDAGGTAWHARKLLLATGYARFHPRADGEYKEFFKVAGKCNVFYCPDCEAPEAFGKQSIVIGAGPADWAAGTTIGLSRYTDRLTVLLAPLPEIRSEDRELSEEKAANLEKRGIGVVRGVIRKLITDRACLCGIELENGETLRAEAFFVSSPGYGRTDLAKQLGVTVAATGNHAQPQSQRGDTNIPGVFIAGDLRPITQQVSVALGTGNLAAIMIDQGLRKEETW